MFLRNPFAGAFGLDIGDLTIKLVQLERAFRPRGSFFVRELRIEPLPPGLIVDGEIQQPELVRKKILHLLGREENSKYKPIKTPWVAASLPEIKTFTKLISISSDVEPTEADVLYHAKKHLPFELDDAYIDWKIVKTPDFSSNKYDIIVGAAPKVVADVYTYLLASVGLSPIILEVEALALCRSMITDYKDYGEEARVILDLGATRSILIVYDKGNIQFSTTLNFSGELVTTALEQGLKLERAQAGELKINNGLIYDQRQPKYLMIVSAMAEGLLEEIRLAFQFYKDHFENTNNITHITMCGGGAKWLGLDNYLSRKLRVAARPGNQWKNLHNPKLAVGEHVGNTGLASAIGLALLAARNQLNTNE